MKVSLRIAFLLVALSSIPLSAQPLLRIPQVSPRAEVTERFGVTDVTVSYHRPSVNGRRIWGGLVAYDVPWRAGANDNTTVSFSTPVAIEGQPLPEGEYSLFMIPGEKEWTVVLNRFTGGWGTYSYDQSQDALRVKVTPQPSEMQERLAYTFDDATNDAVTLNLRWEKLRVPIRVTAETTKLTMKGIDESLRSALHWVPQAWREAAAYAARSGNTDAALRYLDSGMQLTPDGPSLRLKARLLEQKGDAKGAKELRELAAKLNPDTTWYISIYDLLGAKKLDEARTAVEAKLAADPKAWRSWALLGTIYGQKGDAAKAKESFDKAMSLAPGQSERVEVQDSINDLAAEKK